MPAKRRPLWPSSPPPTIDSVNEPDPHEAGFSPQVGSPSALSVDARVTVPCVRMRPELFMSVWGSMNRAVPDPGATTIVEDRVVVRETVSVTSPLAGADAPGPV